MTSHEVGKSHTTLQTLGSVVGMPAMDLTTFQDDDKELTTDRYVLFILCVCECAHPITVSVSSVYFHFFTDRLTFRDDWTEFLFLLYANHTLIQCAGLPTATFSVTQFCLPGAAATIALTSDRSYAVEGEGREGQGWLFGEGDRGVDVTKS